MSVEIEEVRRFLAEHAPFSTLSEAALVFAGSNMEVMYSRRGDTIITAGERNDFLYVVRSGAVDVLDGDGVLLDRREAGRSFGYSTLAAPGNGIATDTPEAGEDITTSIYTIVCVEDSLLMRLPRAAFDELAAQSPELLRYYAGLSTRIRAAADRLQQEAHSDALRIEIGSFKIPNPAHIAPEVSLQEAARIMGEKDVSSLLVVTEGSLEGQLCGIITDRDMRKVVASGTSIDAPVETIMARNLATVSSEQMVFEALLLLTELHIHHLPVVDGGKITGIVTAPDIMRLLQANPLYLTSDLSRRDTPEAMAEVYDEAQQMAVRFIERGASPSEVTGLLTVVADAMARKLLQLAEATLGAPPVPYAFVVLGSQGRREMGLASDQDNALILSDAYSPQEHGQYFAQLSEFVCKGLATAGQELCPGDMMASNPQWRMTVSEWRNAFHGWITAPEGDALLYAQTFFDMRPIHGDKAMAEAVHAQAMESAMGAPRLHAHLAALAARREPPLGFFRGLVVDRSGAYKNTLNVKKGGTAALVQMARLFAIVSGSDVLGSQGRIHTASTWQAKDGKTAVSARSAADLSAALEFLTTVTLRHQAEQVREGKDPDYHINPEQLSKLDREHLRDAFHVIKSMQNALSLKYPVRSI